MMGLRALAGYVLIALAVPTCMAAAELKEAPRFSLSATTAVAGDSVELRVRIATPAPKATLRRYLVAREAAGHVRSRSDPRLNFIGALGMSRPAPLVFTVPPLEPGNYALAYWCRGCLPPGQAVATRSSPTLRVTAPTGEGCPATKPNGNAPPGVPRSSWKYHGNGVLAVLLQSNATVLTTNSLGGYKMFWVAKQGAGGLFRVSYRMLETPAEALEADTVSGSLGGYAGPSWASRMSFEPGCWRIAARVFDVSLSFVAQVVRGTG